MVPPDLNLLITLEALLAEGSVAKAARRLRLSPSAMSRQLARLRETTGDPLLVRAGRGLVATPRAQALAERVAHLVRDAEAVLRPVEALDLSKLARTFVFRTADGFVESFGPRLIARVGAEAPGVKLHFLQKPDRESAGLRDGTIDLETAVVGAVIGPEVRARALFEDGFVGVVRPGHPLCQGEITPDRYALTRHVAVARGAGPEMGPGDEALKPLGLAREVAVLVGGYSAALALVRSTDLVATVPARHTAGLRAGLHSFPLPVPAPGITISLLWHPRMDGDAGHRWLRGCVRDACSA